MAQSFNDHLKQMSQFSMKINWIYYIQIISIDEYNILKVFRYFFFKVDEAKKNCETSD